MQIKRRVEAGEVCDEKKEEGDDVDVDDGMKKQTLVLFSHGLTGTGEENSIFCAALAKRGYVVAWIHHRNRSSNQAPLHDGGVCTTSIFQLMMTFTQGIGLGK